jgi:hypothetical protein
MGFQLFIYSFYQPPIPLDVKTLQAQSFCCGRRKREAMSDVFDVDGAVFDWQPNCYRALRRCRQGAG